MSDTPKQWVIGVGYLGSRLAASLRSLGQAVLGIDIKGDCEAIGDAADRAFLKGLLAKYGQPTRVYLCQATSGGDACAYKHAYADVVDALLALTPDAGLIFTSSCSVYGEKGGAIVDEASPTKAQSERAMILRSVEEKVLSFGGHVARLSALYGSGRSVLWPRYCQGVIPIAGPANRMLNYVHVNDVVSALLLLGELPSGIYNLSAESISKTELLCLLREISTLSCPTQEPLVSRRGESSQVVDASKLRKVAWCPQYNLATFLAEEYAKYEI